METLKQVKYYNRHLNLNAFIGPYHNIVQTQVSIGGKIVSNLHIQCDTLGLSCGLFIGPTKG